jgi:hypothetical protein
MTSLIAAYLGDKRVRVDAPAGASVITAPHQAQRKEHLPILSAEHVLLPVYICRGRIGE